MPEVTATRDRRRGCSRWSCSVCRPASRRASVAARAFGGATPGAAADRQGRGGLGPRGVPATGRAGLPEPRPRAPGRYGRIAWRAPGAPAGAPHARRPRPASACTSRPAAASACRGRGARRFGARSASWARDLQPRRELDAYRHPEPRADLTRRPLRRRDRVRHRPLLRRRRARSPPATTIIDMAHREDARRPRGLPRHPGRRARSRADRLQLLGRDLRRRRRHLLRHARRPAATPTWCAATSRERTVRDASARTSSARRSRPTARAWSTRSASATPPAWRYHVLDLASGAGDAAGRDARRSTTRPSGSTTTTCSTASVRRSGRSRRTAPDDRSFSWPRRTRPAMVRAN